MRLWRAAREDCFNMRSWIRKEKGGLIRLVDYLVIPCAAALSDNSGTNYKG